MAVIGALLCIPMISNPAGFVAGVAAFKASFPALVPVSKLLIAWPLTYHTLAGARHWVFSFSFLFVLYQVF